MRSGQAGAGCAPGKNPAVPARTGGRRGRREAGFPQRPQKCARDTRCADGVHDHVLQVQRGGRPLGADRPPDGAAAGDVDSPYFFSPLSSPFSASASPGMPPCS
jgi:hypothetical protein